MRRLQTLHPVSTATAESTSVLGSGTGTTADRLACGGTMAAGKSKGLPTVKLDPSASPWGVVTFTIPPLTVVPPEYVLLPDRMVVPDPAKFSAVWPTTPSKIVPLQFSNAPGAVVTVRLEPKVVM